MKTKMIKLVFCSFALSLAIQVNANAQSNSLTTIIKQHFNETVQNVKSTDDTDQKRVHLNNSFTDILSAIDRLEKSSSLDEEDAKQLESLKSSISDKMNQLNGLDGYDEIQDEDLDDFTDYSQQDMEQASRNITISLTTALLIVIILLLL